MKLYTDCGKLNIRKAPTPRVDASQVVEMSLRTPPSLLADRLGIFYFFLLFLLSRKVRNVTIKLPKDISKPIIPMNIKIISAAVMIRTSLPMYSGEPVIGSGGCRPCHRCFSVLRFYHSPAGISIRILIRGIYGRASNINLKTISRRKTKDQKALVLRTFRSKCPLFELNRPRWLTGHIIHYSIDSLHLIYNSIHNFLQYFPGNLRALRRHKINCLNRP